MTIMLTPMPPPEHHAATYPHGRAVELDVQSILQVIACQGHNDLPPGVIPSLYRPCQGQGSLVW